MVSKGEFSHSEHSLELGCQARPATVSVQPATRRRAQPAACSLQPYAHQAVARWLEQQPGPTDPATAASLLSQVLG